LFFSKIHIIFGLSSAQSAFYISFFSFFKIFSKQLSLLTLSKLYNLNSLLWSITYNKFDVEFNSILNILCFKNYLFSIVIFGREYLIIIPDTNPIINPESKHVSAVT